MILGSPIQIATPYRRVRLGLVPWYFEALASQGSAVGELRRSPMEFARRSAGFGARIVDCRRPSLRAIFGRMIGDIRQHLEAAPFEPFKIVTSSGKRYPVQSADHAGLNPGGTRVVVWFNDDASVTIAGLHLVAIEKGLPPSNGEPSDWQAKSALTSSFSVFESKSVKVTPALHGGGS